MIDLEGAPSAGADSAAAAPPRMLVAGMGNVLEGDDGFGVRALERLAEVAAAGGLPPGVTLTEVGIGGLHLVQTLMEGFDALIVIDAVDRGGEPGSLFYLEPTVPGPDELTEAERASFLANMHYTVPAKAFLMARALGVLPERVLLVGCQPAGLELGIGLTPVVEEAVTQAVARVLELTAEYARGAAAPGGRILELGSQTREAAERTPP